MWTTICHKIIIFTVYRRKYRIILFVAFKQDQNLYIYQTSRGLYITILKLNLILIIAVLFGVIHQTLTLIKSINCKGGHAN